MSDRPVLYYAGPLFTAAERAWNATNAGLLRTRLPGVELLLPQEFCAIYDAPAGKRPDFASIFAACVGQLERAQAVLAVIDGADADSGTAFEMGYAYARGLPVVALRTDWRPAEDVGGNCMLTRSSAHLVADLEQAVAALAPLLAAGHAPRHATAGLRRAGADREAR